ncbi:hypothetical protein BDAP_001971 [Binucleata daphniae]
MHADFTSKFEKNKILFDLEMLEKSKLKNIYVFPIRKNEFVGICFIATKFVVFYLYHAQNKKDFGFVYSLRFCREKLCKNARDNFDCVSLVEMCIKIKSMVKEEDVVECKIHGYDTNMIFCKDKDDKIDNLRVLRKMIKYTRSGVELL